MWTCGTCGARNWQDAVACHKCRQPHVAREEVALAAATSGNDPWQLAKYPPLMSARQISIFERIRDLFEGRQAVLSEKGLLRVRVISVLPRHRRFHLRVEEIPTEGLGTGRFELCKGRPEQLFQARLGGSCEVNPSFSPDHWSCCGTVLYFAPETVISVVQAAALAQAKGLDARERFYAVRESMRFPRQESFKPEFIFPNHEEERVLIRDSPPAPAALRGEWISCPRCGRRFKPSHSSVWNGERHSCGQRLLIEDRV